ncbi:peptidoglycan DD-metalloendopeptidase family protein [Trichothermofontia sp.]
MKSSPKKHACKQSLRLYPQRRRWITGLGWVCGLGLLQGGGVLAQEAADLMVPTYEAAPPVAEPAPLPPPTIAPPADPAPALLPQVILPEAPPEVLLAPQSEAPVAGKDTVAPAPGTYIDASDYSLGATSSYEAAPDVVLSERSTGCQAVVAAGSAAPGTLCPPSASADTAWSPAGTAGNAYAAPPPDRWGQPTGINANSVFQFNPGQTLASGQAYLERTAFGRTLSFLKQLGNANRNALFPLPFPVPITSVFGWRLHPISGEWRFHSGTDLAADVGTPVLAAFPGKVTIADFMGGYGLTVVLEHPEAAQETLYAHLSQILVRPGDTVEQGTVIGLVGSTGNSTGPHLHFEVRQLTPEGWITLDPGHKLELALARLVQALQLAQAAPEPTANLPKLGPPAPLVGPPLPPSA